jgi:3-phosphoglycerate kinase
MAAVLGGAKVSDKLMLVEHLLPRVDALLIGGGMAYTFLRALGHGVGRSLLEPERIEMARRVLESARRQGTVIALPLDAVVAEGVDSPSGRVVGIREIPPTQMGLDIGPRTRERFAEALKPARTIVWNGPMGVFEFDRFAEGTRAVARAVAESGAFSYIGGGDSVAAIQKLGFGDRVSHLSTGGGASLELLEGKTLPGVACLSK